MLIHSPTTRIQDLGILRGVYYATDNSQLSFAGQRDRTNVCKPAEHFYSAREIRASRAEGRGNVNRIGIDPPRQIAATDAVRAEPDDRRRTDRTTVHRSDTSTTGADGRFNVKAVGFSGERTSRPRVDFKVSAVYRQVSHRRGAAE